MHGWRDDDFVAPGGVYGHQRRFCKGGRAVVMRRGADIHAGQIADHALEFEDGLQRALAHFGLIGRVSCKEFSASYDVIDQRRNVVVVCACAEEAGVMIQVGVGIRQAL